MYLCMYAGRYGTNYTYMYACEGITVVEGGYVITNMHKASTTDGGKPKLMRFVMQSPLKKQKWRSLLIPPTDAWPMLPAQSMIISGKTTLFQRKTWKKHTQNIVDRRGNPMTPWNVRLQMKEFWDDLMYADLHISIHRSIHPCIIHLWSIIHRFPSIFSFPAFSFILPRTMYIRKLLTSLLLHGITHAYIHRNKYKLTNKIYIKA